MTPQTIDNRAATAAVVLTAAAVSALASVALSVMAGEPFGTLHAVALLVLTLAFAPVMLGFFRLGGRMPIDGARLYLFVGIAAVGIRAFVQVAVLIGAVSASYLDEAAIAAISVTSGLIGAWLIGAHLLAGAWLRPVPRGLGILAGVSLMWASAVSLETLGYELVLLVVAVWGWSLGRTIPVPDKDPESGGEQAAKGAARSWRWFLVGMFIALVVPVSFLVVAVLESSGITVVSQDASTMQVLTGIALTEVLLGPLGLMAAGWSAGVRGVLAWIMLFAVGVPLLAFAWFLCVATLSGVLGSPF